jgi:hypothetical protein
VAVDSRTWTFVLHEPVAVTKPNFFRHSKHALAEPLRMPSRDGRTVLGAGYRASGVASTSSSSRCRSALDASSRRGLNRTMKRYATFGLLCAFVLPGIGGCGPDADLVFGSSSTGAGGGGGSGGSGACESSRMDLVIAVDTSRGMGQKHFFLAEAIPTLLQGLTNPACIDPSGVAAPSQPTTPDAVCPSGLVRAFAPQADIHIGVISSSLGGHGADSCPDVDMQGCPGTILLYRSCCMMRYWLKILRINY